MTIIKLSKFSPVFGNPWDLVRDHYICDAIIAKSEWFDFAREHSWDVLQHLAADGNWSVPAISLVIEHSWDSLPVSMEETSHPSDREKNVIRIYGEKMYCRRRKR